LAKQYEEAKETKKDGHSVGLTPSIAGRPDRDGVSIGTKATHEKFSFQTYNNNVVRSHKI
jgi:hypothetical protein